MFLIVNKKVNFYGFVEVMKHFYIIKIKRLTKILNLRWTFFKKKHIDKQFWRGQFISSFANTTLCVYKPIYDSFPKSSISYNIINNNFNLHFCMNCSNFSEKLVIE